MSIAAAAKLFSFLTGVNWKGLFKSVGKIAAWTLAVWLVYQAIMIPYERGKIAQLKEDKALINELNGKLKESESSLAEYKNSYDKWVEDGRTAENTMIQEYLAAMEKVRGQLNISEQTIAQKQELIDEISSRIPDQVDGACLNLNGFVGLYNESLKTGAGHAVHYVPRTGQADVATSAKPKAGARR